MANSIIVRIGLALLVISVWVIVTASKYKPSDKDETPSERLWARIKSKKKR